MKVNKRRRRVVGAKLRVGDEILLSETWYLISRVDEGIYGMSVELKRGSKSMLLYLTPDRAYDVCRKEIDTAA